MIERECDRSFCDLGEKADRTLGRKGRSHFRKKRAIPYGIATHARTLKKQQLRYAQDIIRLL